MNNSDLRRTHKAFTLVELMVVIVIIAILGGISTTAIVKFRKSADKTLVMSNMRQLQTANVGYAADFSSNYVSPKETIDGITYEWWKNPGFVSQLKSEEATYVGNGLPDVELPISLMDPYVAKARDEGYDELAGSYAYNTQGMPQVGGEQRGFKTHTIDDPGRTMAFITSDFSARGEVEETTSNIDIVYRHEEKAIAVFYDGHAAMMSEAAITKESDGAYTPFWDANPEG